MEKEGEASEGGSDLCARLYPCVALPTCARSPPASAQAPERRVTMRRNAAMGHASASDLNTLLAHLGALLCLLQQLLAPAVRHLHAQLLYKSQQIDYLK